MWDHCKWILIVWVTFSVFTGLVRVGASSSSSPAIARKGWFGLSTSSPQDSALPQNATTTSRATANDENSPLVNSYSGNRTSTVDQPAWKLALPETLKRRKTLQRILIPTSPHTHIELFLLGTSHVSNDSSSDVKLLLQHVEPDVVFLELCDQRISMLMDAPPVLEDTKNMSFWKRVDMVQQHGNMSKGSAMGTVLLTQVQDDYALSLDVELGGEFRVAYKWCNNNNRQPVHLILGDRPLQLTLHRAWESLSWWSKTKVLAALVYSSLKSPKPDEIRQWMQSILEGESDVLTESIADLRKHFPSLERVIIKERDAYMACKLYQTCRLLPKNTNHRLVAIVGAGHLTGISEWLTNGNGESPEQVLMELVETRKHSRQDLTTLVTDVTELPLG